ncbi:inorganic phosphate transporter [Legionella oakridgensis]|uniref:Phosphate/sulfate permease n=2 Tax=Legionella oakridgensis TaxID=29423 RepID=W0BIH4_9GAMM|nr:inorganic phosphate transporter [Legionella oakridgensis]AHE68417.1 phosphate/sulfate permease [Legionella oakridgensis ATCC 33761 = DSM 21215]ETO92086.1 phosphate permease [Legionella oakridgensis RV-2-2007]KTD38427.1 low affinity inorganic phosphate transporter [Legionella oakridgensis]STY21356.1 inorganic phosphate transporter, PiT family [Legionella longbeachae]
METSMLFILCVIFIAYLFDFINGFHDAANSIATIVTTGVLTPRQAVLWAAFFNFIAFMFFHLMVAKTIGYDLIDTHLINTSLIFSALLGAISWNLLTWYYGLPSSSSHALIGGLAGAAVALNGLAALKPAGFIKVAIGIFVSPILGFLISLLFAFILSRLLRRHSEHTLNKTFKLFQLASSAFLSLTHGGNDAQKTMGIIAVLLFSTSWLDGVFYIPFWVVISCQAVISLGTLAGGWRIVHTMGNKITKLNTMKGCIAETGAASIIFVSTEFGIPVSTTQTVTGAIAGVGLTTGLKGTHWPVLGKIYLSWLLTIPAAGMIAAILQTLLQ